ncbi:MAG: hypothetical protein U0900_23690 [Myxococcota bacterium]
MIVEQRMRRGGLRSRLGRTILSFGLIGLAGCLTQESEVSGLRPLFPPAVHRLSVFGPLLDDCFATVDSLQPTLRWQPFFVSGEEDVASRASGVTYELRIWQMSRAAPGRLVYSRTGLVEPFHVVEEPLRSGRAYFWTFRAHHDRRGEPRVSDWAERLIGRVRIVEDHGVPGSPHEVLHLFYEPHCFRTSDDAERS